MDPVRLGRRALVVLTAGCAPLAQPVVVTPGGVFLASRDAAERDSAWCRLADDDTLDCTPVAPTETGIAPATRWERHGDGETWLLQPHTGVGARVCRPDGSDCDTLAFDDPHEWARPYLHVATGDVDGDGAAELVFTGITDEDGDRVPPRRCHEDDGALDCETLPIDTGRDQSATLADLDGDGHLDALIGVLDNETWAESPRVCAGDGGGDFSCSAWSPADPDDASPLASQTRVADFDGDGQVDVLVLHAAQYNAVPLVCTGDPAVPPDRWCIDTPARPLPVPEFYYQDTGTWIPIAPALAEVVDLDGDGDRDLLAMGGGGGLYACLNDGRGGFSCDVAITLAPGTPSADGLSCADVDGDGTLEIVALSGNHGEWRTSLCRFVDREFRCEALDDVRWSAVELIGARFGP